MSCTRSNSCSSASLVLDSTRLGRPLTSPITSQPPGTSASTSVLKARAHAGLGDLHQRQGEHGRAVAHWQQALTTYRDLRAPKTAELQEKIANTRRPQRPALPTANEVSICCA